MAAQAQKPRRRIVPQLITSPSSQDRDADALLTAEQPQAAPPPAVDQREQSEWARENLGPDRKVFLDLSALSNTEIDWKQICKERGVQKTKKAATVQNGGEANDPLLLRGRTGRQEDNWSRLLAKLEATYCLGAASEDEGDAEREEEGSESGASDDEADEEGGKGASDGGEGGKEGGEGGSGKEGGEGKKKGPKNDYDYMDDWIDDEEFIQLVAHDKRKPKHSGFFISKGEIERTEELLPGFEDLEKEKKRGGGGGGGKRKAEAGDDGAAAPAAKEAKPGGAAAGEKKKRKQAEAAEEGGEGAGSEGKPPKKRKKKVLAEAVSGAAAEEAGAAPATKPLSIAEQARLAGQLAAAGTGAVPTAAAQAAPTPPKKRAPYEMPQEVAAAIQAIREVASQQPAPAPVAAGPAEAGEEGAKKARRVLPKPIKDALFRFSATFLAEVDKHGTPASTRMMDELLAFLEPFASRPSILNYLRNANKERKPAEAPKGLSEEAIREMIREKIKPLPEGSDDDFEAPTAPRGSAPPSGTQGAASQAAAPERRGPNKYVKALDRGVQEQVYLYISSRLGGEKLHSPRGKLLQNEVYNWFPPNSIDLAAISSIYSTFKNREKRQAEKAAQQAAAAAGTTSPAGAATTAAAAQQQQQQQQVQATASGSMVSPEVFAALAIASAEKRLQQAGGEVQPEAQQAVESTQLSAAQVAAALQAAAPAAGPPATAAQQPGKLADAAAAIAEEALAAAAATTPQRLHAMHQQQQPQEPQPQQAVAQQQPVPQQTLQAQAPPQQGDQQQAQQGPAQGAAVVVSDDAAVAAGVGHGAAEAELRQLLAAAQAAKPANYSSVFTKVMMVAGPKGISTTEAASKAVEMGWANWEATSSHVKSSLAKASHHPWVAYVGASRYALTSFPGTQAQQRPSRGTKKGGSAGPGGNGATGGSSPVQADGAATGEAVPDASQA